MIINANTKVASLIKHNLNALEAIVKLSPRFEKLRNPFLRKVIASRTSIFTAAKMGGCTVQDFYNALQPLGFIIDDTDNNNESETQKIELPEFMQQIKLKEIIEFDVRSIISSGKDPLTQILQKIKEVNSGEILKIINSFIPTPLIALLEKKGFESYVEIIDTDLVNTYFFCKGQVDILISKPVKKDSENWDNVLKKFNNNFSIIDVRELEMPLPMVTILESLDKLETGKALFVYHKKIPVFLLPELEEKGFDYRIKELNDHQIEMIIFKNLNDG